ncbi:bifunctional tetrahydrofolate synthase/dihydrofolate synthase [Paraglaciecola sp. 2405UD69-4]|uniref:bifunctional tetrahydrofolate synthase/dihydrofolate synthase n=1 Tax=Paraglaciecola sp. 2405UD69-4 TaxID=3391836 RepID=UPI0039C8D0A8
MSDNLVSSMTEKQSWDLGTWLKYLESIHPSNIELGLSRITKVFNTLNLNFDTKKVITVAGTNGKGTTCAFIEQALISKGHSVAVFSSPHLIDYRERVRIQNQMLPESVHCQSFIDVENARQGVSLTYFEFGALAALCLMAQSDADYILLEVGLGGRLDAVNIVDPDIAVITSIGLDHQDWLGDTREKIAVEKAGIFRSHIPVVIGEPDPPSTLISEADRFNVKAFWQGKDFSYQLDGEGFHWKDREQNIEALPLPSIPLQNVSTGLKVLAILETHFSTAELADIITNTKLPGRRQVIQKSPTVMLDVAHNPQATELLVKDLKSTQYNRVLAVVAMLADKDIRASLQPMVEVVTEWFCADLDVPRGAKGNFIASNLTTDKKVINFPTVVEAYENALEKAHDQDLVVVFGSFFTVAEILNLKGLSLSKEA